MEITTSRLARDLDLYLLENRMNLFDRKQKVRPVPTEVTWLGGIQNLLQDPEVFAPIMVMLEESSAIKSAEKQDVFIQDQLALGYESMLRTGHWVYDSPA